MLTSSVVFPQTKQIDSNWEELRPSSPHHPLPLHCLSLILLHFHGKARVGLVLSTQLSKSELSTAQNLALGWWSHTCTTDFSGIFSAALVGHSLPCRWSLDTCSSCWLPVPACATFFLSVAREQGELGLCLPDWKGFTNPLPFKLLSNGIVYGT